ncbi:MAG: YDG domain-containing protein [Clostridia bacterium]
MRNSKLVKLTLQKGGLMLIVMLCVAVAFSAIGFSSVNLPTQNVAEAAVSNVSGASLPTPDSNKVQTITYGMASSDWISGVTLDYTGDAAWGNRFYASTANAEKGFSPDGKGNASAGADKLARPTAASLVGAMTKWDMVFAFDETLSPFIASGKLQIHVSANYVTKNTDKGSLHIKSTDKITTLEDAPDSDPHTSGTDNGVTYQLTTKSSDANWENVTAKYTTVGFRIKNEIGSCSGEFTNIKVSFRLNLSASTQVLSNSSTKVNTGFKGLLPQSATRDIAVADGSSVGFSTAYAFGNKGTFTNDWGLAKQILFTSASDDYAMTDGVTITKNGAPAETKTISEAAKAGWMFGGSSLTRSSNGTIFNLTFSINGDFTVTAKTVSGRTMTINFVIGNIDKENPNIPTLTPAIGWNNGGNVDVALGNTAALGSPASPVRYFYKYTTHATKLNLAPDVILNPSKDAQTLFNAGQYTDSSSTFTISGLADGFYKVKVFAVDAAGNAVISQQATFKVESKVATSAVSATVDSAPYDGAGWTNKPITFNLSNPNGALSPVSYQYKQGSTGAWTNITGKTFIFNTKNVDFADNFYFRSNSEANPAYSPEVTFAVKYDTIAPSAPTIGDMPIPTFENWYTTAWNFATTVTPSADTHFGNTFVLYCQTMDKGNLVGKNENMLQCAATPSAISVTLDFNVALKAVAGEKNVNCWVVDQAGNIGAIATKSVYVDANVYQSKSEIYNNPLFPGSTATWGEIIRDNVSEGKRGETKKITIKAKAGYQYFKLLEDGVEKPATPGTNEFYFDATCGKSVVVYLRRVIEIQLPTNASLVYNGALQNAIVVAKTADVKNPEFAEVGRAVKFSYNDGTTTFTAGVRDFRQNGYTVTYDVTEYNTNNPNYIINLASGAPAEVFRISKKDIKVVPKGGQFKLYGAVDPTFLTENNLLSTDTFSGALTREIGERVKYYTFELGTIAISDGNNGENYNITGITPVQFEVRKRSVTINISTANIVREYNAKDTDIDVTADSLEFLAGNLFADRVTFVVDTGDGCTATFVFSGKINYKWNDKSVSKNKNVQVYVSNLSATATSSADNVVDNFTFTGHNATASDGEITKRNISISWVTFKDKVYDGTDVAELLGYDPRGTLNNESVNVQVDKSGLKFASANVGTYDIVVESRFFSLYGANKDNYKLIIVDSQGQPTASLTAKTQITPIIIRFKNELISKFYDGTNAYIATGNEFIILNKLPNGESLSIVYDNTVAPVFTGVDATRYESVTFKQLKLNADNANTQLTNYKLHGSADNGEIASYFVGASIYKATIKGFVESGKTMIYGDDAPKDIAITYKVVSLGGAACDYEIKKVNDKWYYTVNAQDVEIVGFEEVRLFAKSTKTSNVGSYPIGYYNGVAKNFEFAVESSTISVTAATLTLNIPDITRIYGTENIFNIDWVGFKNTDNASNSLDFKAPSISSDATLTSDVSVDGYLIRVDKLGSARNYKIELGTVGKIFITKATVTGFMFDGNLPQVGGRFIKSDDYTGYKRSMSVGARAGYFIDYKYFSDEAMTVAVSSTVNAGTYYVKATINKVKPNSTTIDDGYIPQILLGELHVRRVFPVIQIGSKIAEYDGTQVEIGNADVSEGLTVSYFYTDASGTRLDGAPSDAGVYTVIVSYDGYNKNYKPYEVSVTLTINKAKIFIIISQDRFVEDGTVHTVAFTSNDKSNVLNAPIFKGNADTSVAGTYEYDITSKNPNYLVIGGKGSITVGKQSLPITGGGNASVIGDTLLSENNSLIVKNFIKDKNTAATAPEILVWTEAERLVSGQDKVKGLINVSLLINNADGTSVSIQPNGQLRISVASPDGKKFKNSDKVYLMRADGTFTNMNGTLNNGNMEFITDEVGNFVVVSDGTAREKTLYVALSFAGLALTALIMVIVIRKYRLLKLLKSATKATR